MRSLSLVMGLLPLIVVSLDLGMGMSFAQERAPHTAGSVFEAATVKLSPPGPVRQGRMAGGPGSSDPGRISYSNVILRAWFPPHTTFLSIV